MNPEVKRQLDIINRKWSRPQNNRIPVVVNTDNDYGIQFWTPEMIKTGTAKNTDNTISTLMATAGWYQANESLQEIVRRVIKEESGRIFVQTFQNGKQLLGSDSSRVLPSSAGKQKIMNSVKDLESSLSKLTKIKPSLLDGGLEIRVIDANDKVLFKKEINL